MNDLQNRLVREAIIRTEGIHPAADRLKVGLNAIVGRPDGSVVKLCPDGTEEMLVPPKQQRRPATSESPSPT